MTDDDYAGREHSKVKHWILQHYLQKLVYKVGPTYPAITYVDGFAGPWQASTENLSDTSPQIALQGLRAACDGLVSFERHRPQMKCVFVEKDLASYQRLKYSLSYIDDVDVNVLQGTFEEAIPEVLRIVDGTFAFFFIDPTGWTGYGMQAITPLLRYRPGEALINFMTGDIIRFVDDDRSPARSSFVDLFGTSNYRDRWQGLEGQDRCDAIVEAYCDRVRLAGGYEYVVAAPILHRFEDRIRYHLIYATNHVEGLRVFRDAERSSMHESKRTRAEVKEKRDVEKTNQPHLFPIGEADSYYDQLRARFTHRARHAVQQRLMHSGYVSFDELEILALCFQMVWTADLKDWIKEWKKQDLLKIEGMTPRSRVPQPKKGHSIRWTGF